MLLDRLKNKKIKAKYKKEMLIISFVSIFFMGYFLGIKAFAILEKDDTSIIVDSSYQTNNKKSLVSQFAYSNSIYLSNDKIERTKIFEGYKDSIKDFLLTSTMAIREPRDFKALYEGLSNSGVKFYTDLDIIKLENTTDIKYYKISESIKNDFINLLTKSIYFSSSSLKNSSNWDSISITNTKTGEVKKIKRKNFEEFASKLSIIRECGEIQPNKSQASSDNTFNIIIKTKHDVEYKIETMGKHYIKIELNNTNNLLEYFEVKTTLYDYIQNSIFYTN